MGRAPRSSAAVFLRRAAPWVIAASILGYLLATVDLDQVGAAIEETSLPSLVALTAGLIAAMIATDVLALWVAFREALPAAKLSAGDVLGARAPSYLLAILNYGAGQGGVVYFLKRNHGVEVAQGVGAVLLTTAAYLLVVALLVGAGLLAGSIPDEPELRWLVIAMAAGVPVYLAVVALRPAFLADKSLFQPLFDAGVGGTLRVAGARVVYVIVLMAGHWAAMRLFGIDVPLVDALARLPLLFFLGALPISPAGLGTAQAAAVALFSEYAPGADAAARQGVVLAYSLSVQVVGMTILAVVGLGFLRRATRTA